MIRYLWRRIHWRYVWAFTAGQVAGIITASAGWADWATVSLSVLVAAWVAEPSRR